MAFTFVGKPTAVLTATLTGTDGKKQINIPGCNVDETSGDNAIAQANKILGIGGKSVVADAKLALDPVKKGVVES